MELLDKIKVYNEAYRKGEPLISDNEYDVLVAELKLIDPENDWFKHIEPAFVSASRKRKLPIPMRSLNKIKSIGELTKWKQSLGLHGATGIVVMPKFDGVSLLVDEFDQIAYSRGGEENEGQDCSGHYKMLNLSQPNKKIHYTYGEFMISRDSWKENFYGKRSPLSGDIYKSPRNTAAGMLNRDVAMDDIKYATFFRYGIDEGSIDYNEYERFSQIIFDICQHYNQEHEYKVCSLGELTEELLKSWFVEWNQKYPIDGVVIYLDSIYMWKQMGRHQTTGNPLYAIAYKHPDFTESFETTVKSVNWAISKSGALKPVVNIEAVDTGDCNMENPTGYNAGWINDNSIAKGAKILVTRSGGVIPKIISVLSPASDEECYSLWDTVAVCPHCGCTTSWNSNYIELMCTNPNCSGIKLAKAIHFYNTCGAENMGDEILSKIFNAGFDSIPKMLTASPYELMDIEGFAEGITNIVHQNNKRILQGLELPVFMHASDCFEGIGKIKAQKLLDEMSDQTLQEFYNMSYVPMDAQSKEFLQLDKTHQSFELGITKFFDFVKDTGIPIIAPVRHIDNKDGKFFEKTICVSGFRDSSIEKFIQMEGGKISSSVSKKTWCLIVQDKSATSSKISKAQELGTQIMSKDEFLEKFMNI